MLTEEITMLYVTISDALFEMEGESSDLKDCLEHGLKHIEVLMALLENLKVTKRMKNEWYERIGIDIPEHYTLKEAIDTLEKLNEHYYN